ncbi:hypothetical protein K437DRAFT_279982 [Tilletiaria anomala UBC 951]|uniref:Uncharacterized protein n=1 Tax=Tilletiaria anomala (strain ATCC 24038 / CBS 436.72 / UBC 951) TaxID=1037660 RepID=A0A066WIC1_TILAU|nr:uncharacterized protein K437DRAFT_279982 [Tilletiaria anomala UBC 951]KDN53586.1 hypothetical protein K437DRAFT_279982 [Tilletiaria anomala UBC 951]
MTSISLLGLQPKVVSSTAFRKHALKSHPTPRIILLILKRYWRAMPITSLCWLLNDCKGSDSMITSIVYGSVINFSPPSAVVGTLSMNKIGRKPAYPTDVQGERVNFIFGSPFSSASFYVPPTMSRDSQQQDIEFRDYLAQHGYKSIFGENPVTQHEGTHEELQAEKMRKQGERTARAAKLLGHLWCKYLNQTWA